MQKNSYKQHFKPLFIILLSALSYGCQNNLEDISPLSQPIEHIGEEIQNGRFVFSSRETLSKAIKELQNQEIESMEKDFGKLYEKGFRSYKPIISPSDKHMQKLFSKQFANTRISGEEDGDTDEEGLIADPFLASLVNEKNEIIVNDTLYKFTEQGLFFSYVNDSTALFEYLDANPGAGLYNSKVDPCLQSRVETGVTTVDDGVYRFVAPPDYECGEEVEEGVYTPIPSYPQTSQQVALQDRINSLPVCSGNDSWFFGNFGKRYNCISSFGDNHRIKTEFWDQNYLFYKSVGALSKVQTRTLGAWWASEADELHLGINRVLLRYKYPKPNFISLTFPSFNANQIFKAPLYMYNGKFKVRGGLFNTPGSQYNTHFVDTQIDVTKNTLPFFTFGNSQLLNIYIPKIAVIGGYNVNLTTQDITSESNIKELYKMGIDFIKNEINSSNPNQEFAVTHQKNDNEIEVIYFGERYSENNENKIKRDFYQDVSFEIKASWGSTSGWSYSVQPASSSFRDYTHYEVDIYGLARRGTNWKGSRLIR